MESREAFIASATITNIGEVAGEEIVQCYIRDLVAQRVRPVKQLKAFEKIKLDPGESKKISFTIPYQELGYYNNEMEYIVEEGTFEIFIGKNSEDYLSQKIVLYR